jgi:septal ring factor EnvC (AmiA/AmiB activator)
MSDEQNNFQTEGSPRWMGLAVVGLAVLSLVGVGMAWNATNHANEAQQAFAAQSKTIQQTTQSQDGITQRIAQAEQTNAQMQGELNLVTDKLKLTQNQLAAARTQVKQTRADYTKKLDDVQSTLATKASSDDVKALGTDVNGVKTDLDTTKGNLQQLRGEHGELIARNHEELEVLKRLGERDYYEFTLTSKGQKQRVGTMQVEFRGASAKKHQFSVALYVDDMRVEKKNKSINEPIYFYASGSKQPLEMVVNSVGDKKIAGYLSVPKTAATSAKATAATN